MPSCIEPTQRNCRKILERYFLLVFLILFVGCNSSSVKDALDLADGVPRKDLPFEKLAVNAFLNDSRFGTPAQQLAEIRDSLKIRSVRLLFRWDDAVQSSPDAEPNFSFFDSLAAAISPDMNAIVVVTGVPSWMSNASNWTNGNPRSTWVQRLMRRVVRRYANNSRIVGWQVWNEPNNPDFSENGVLGFVDPEQGPQRYVSMLAEASALIRSVSPTKLILNAATTAINQNFDETLDYNRAMRDLAIDSYIDVFAFHYYGKQYENVVRDNGVADFLNGISKPLWITESGRQGVAEQLAYGEQAWPFLVDKVPGIQRIYIYQFAEATPAEQTYGLKNLTPGSALSDMYVELRDR